MGLFDRAREYIERSIIEPAGEWIREQASRIGLGSGVSAEETARELTSFGLTTLAPDIQSTYERLLEDSLGFRHILTIDPDTLPTEHYLPDVSYISDKYAYVFEHDVYDTSGNFIGTKTIRYDAGKLYSNSDASAYAKDYVRRKYDLTETEIDSMRIVGMVRNLSLFDEE